VFLFWTGLSTLIGRNAWLGFNHLPEYFLLVFSALVSFSEVSGLKKDKATEVLAVTLCIVSSVFVVFSLYGWLTEYLIPALQKINDVKELNSGYAPELQISNLRNTYPLGHSNYVAGLLVLLLPWMLQTAIFYKSTIRHVVSISTALAVLLLFLTGSRAGFLSLGLIAFYYSWVFICKVLKTRKSQFLALAALSSILIAAALSTPRVRDSMLQVFGEKTLTESDSQRSMMYRTGLAIFSTHKMSGTGAGMIYDAYPDYCPNVLNGIFFSNQLHSTPLQILVEFGIIGFSFWLIWCFIPIITCLRKHLAFKTNWLSASLISSISYLLFSLFDYQLDFEVFPILMGINLGCLISLTKTCSEINLFKVKLGSLGFYTLMLFSIILLGYNMRDLVSRYHWDAAVDSYYQEEYPKYVEQAKLAMSWNPHDPYYPLDLNLRLSTEINLRNAIDAESLTSVPSLVDLLDEIPNQEILLTNLAWMNVNSNPQEAEVYFRQAIRYAEGKEYLFFGLALCKSRQGDRNAAIKCLALEAFYNPRFLTDAYWLGTDFKELKPDVLLQMSRWLNDSDRDIRMSAWGVWMSELISIFQGGQLPLPQDLNTSSLKDFSRAIHKNPSSSTNSMAQCLGRLWNNPDFDIQKEYLYQKKKVLPDELLAPIHELFKKSSEFPVMDLFELNSSGLQVWLRAERVGRPGYSYIMGHPEMPIPPDPIQIVRNGLVQDFLGNLFPERQQAPLAFLQEKHRLIP